MVVMLLSLFLPLSWCDYTAFFRAGEGLWRAQYPRNGFPFEKIKNLL
jgi:hypothetical protein